MRFVCYGACVWLPLLLTSVAAVPPLPQEVTGGFVIEETASQLPSKPLASSPQGSHDGNLGTLIHKKANLVLDIFYENAHRTQFILEHDIATWDKCYTLRLSEKEFAPMTEHPAFDMIGKAFSFRALYLGKATKSEQGHMDKIFELQPGEIRDTISKIDRLCTAAFPTEAAATTTREDILEATKIFRQTFEVSFNARFSEEIEIMSPKDKSPEWTAPSIMIQNFHQKLTELDDWNQKTLILKLHSKLDRALQEHSLHESEKAEIQPLSQEWGQKNLLLNLHSKLDQILDEFAFHLRYHLAIRHQPIEGLNEKALMIAFHAKLAELPRRVSFLHYVPSHPQTYHPPLDDRDENTLILMLDRILEPSLDSLALLRRNLEEIKPQPLQSRSFGFREWLHEFFRQFGVDL
ncbi:hypothetical protein MJO28_005610 [Puccinia striiformis f. sp. tritici]|uniref:Uncharacterized protein n=1 Tax=Puccinia striiformis f. sp. tritici TaxID=168172 RepID=A0ACC0EL71_9BASI|nr:hypothetical protein Pst134EA_009743 [Puccinia striiformis f. sp. tritici]KAH9469215.1 hypothetical protein Pst134EA_009743 [Puccinia striiformis f. sp. tritici]KAI7955210.1 hypothetical protein MJO28_005610 [Puccinia striiformis f. sp. tritici]